MVGGPGAVDWAGPTSAVGDRGRLDFRGMHDKDTRQLLGMILRVLEDADGEYELQTLANILSTERPEVAPATLNASLWNLIDLGAVAVITPDDCIDATNRQRGDSIDLIDTYIEWNEYDKQWSPRSAGRPSSGPAGVYVRLLPKGWAILDS